jgi:MFS family permease
MKYFINFSLLYRNRNFGLLYLGQFTSFLGTVITGVALPYQIYHETHSTLMVGLLSLAQLLPLLLTALIGGVFADRYHRRTLLLIAEACLIVGCLLLAGNAFLATPKIWILFVVASFMSAINGLHRPALDSIIQQLVQKKDFPVVGSLITFKFSVGMIVGPAIGGLIISYFGLVTTFMVDFISFLISLAALLMMSRIPKPKPSYDASTWSALRQGFRYATSRQELVGTYLVDFVAMIFAMPMALFPAIAQFHGGAKILGLLYSAPAVGALFISLFSTWTKHIKRHGMAVALAAALWGVAIIFFGLTENLFLSLIFLALAGAFDAISGIFRSIIWNETIPNEFRGRLAGIEMISYLSGPKLGDTEAGLIAAAFGITTSIVSGGVLCVVGIAIACCMLPKFWHYRSREDNTDGIEITA